MSPHSRGIKIAKIAIVPEHDVHLLCPFGPLFWYVFTRESCPSHPTTSPFAALADQDVFLGLLLLLRLGFSLPSFGALLTHFRH